MVKEKELICQEALKRVLESEFPRAHYAVGNYKEDAVCLQWNGIKWEVYYGFRNMHDQESLYSTVIEACLGMIDRMCSNEDLRKQLRDVFLNLVVVDKIA